MLMMLMPILFTPETNAITDLIAHVRYTFSLTYFITLCLSYLHPAVKLCWGPQCPHSCLVSVKRADKFLHCVVIPFHVHCYAVAVWIVIVFRRLVENLKFWTARRLNPVVCFDCNVFAVYLFVLILLIKMLFGQYTNLPLIITCTLCVVSSLVVNSLFLCSVRKMAVILCRYTNV